MNFPHRRFVWARFASAILARYDQQEGVGYDPKRVAELADEMLEEYDARWRELTDPPSPRETIFRSRP